MKKILIIILIIGIILGVVVFLGAKLTAVSLAPRKGIKEEISMPNLSGRKIAMIIAFREFRDEEYFIPKEILEGAGAEVRTFSSSLGRAVGKMGGEAEVDGLIRDLDPRNYDAVLFIGGPGAANYIDDEKCHQIARQTVEQNKILGAICIAPAILAKAGVLNGKKATIWSSPLDKSAVKILEENGAIFQKDSVVVDGKIVTGNGPGAAKEFSQAIIKLLEQY